jgi:hypothetical protein
MSTDLEPGLKPLLILTNRPSAPEYNDFDAQFSTYSRSGPILTIINEMHPKYEAAWTTEGLPDDNPWVEIKTSLETLKDMYDALNGHLEAARKRTNDAARGEFMVGAVYDKVQIEGSRAAWLIGAAGQYYTQLKKHLFNLETLLNLTNRAERPEYTSFDTTLIDVWDGPTASIIGSINKLESFYQQAVSPDTIPTARHYLWVQIETSIDKLEAMYRALKGRLDFHRSQQFRPSVRMQEINASFVAWLEEAALAYHERLSKNVTDWRYGLLPGDQMARGGKRKSKSKKRHVRKTLRQRRSRRQTRNIRRRKPIPYRKIRSRKTKN